MSLVLYGHRGDAEDERHLTEEEATSQFKRMHFVHADEYDAWRDGELALPPGDIVAVFSNELAYLDARLGKALFDGLHLAWERYERGRYPSFGAFVSSLVRDAIRRRLQAGDIDEEVGLVTHTCTRLVDMTEDDGVYICDFCGRWWAEGDVLPSGAKVVAEYPDEQWGEVNAEGTGIVPSGGEPEGVPDSE
jgi:hypothetical protein